MGEKPVWSLLLSYYLLIQSSQVRQNINSIEHTIFLKFKTLQHLPKLHFVAYLTSYNYQIISKLYWKVANYEQMEDLQREIENNLASQPQFICIYKNWSKMRVCLMVLCFILVQTQLPTEPPPKFGLLTVTHARNSSYEVIVDYLKHYSQTECYEKLISEICIIWNNEKLPEEVGALDRQLHWRVPVYFYLTNNNSLNHRFRVPKEANADVFYSLDDDIRVDCETLRITYEHYSKSKEQNTGHIVSNQVRNYGYFLSKKTEFYYQGHSYAKFFSIGETGASFYTKHYLNLYYLKLEELSLLRDRVQNITSCQDIFFMAITQHFYPQITPEYWSPQVGYKNTDPSVGLSRKSGLVPLRTSCISYLTDVFGYNPLRQFSKNTTSYGKNWRFPNINLILQAKIQGLINIEMLPSEQREVSNTRNHSTFNSSINSIKQTNDLSKTADPQEQREEVMKESIPRAEQVSKIKNGIVHEENHNKIQVNNEVKPNISISHTNIQNLQERIQTQPKIQQLKQNIQPQSTKAIENEESTRITLIRQASKKKFQIIVFFLVIIILMLIVCIYKLLNMYKQLQNVRSSNSRVMEQQQVPMTEVRD